MLNGYVKQQMPFSNRSRGMFDRQKQERIVFSYMFPQVGTELVTSESRRPASQ